MTSMLFFAFFAYSFDEVTLKSGSKIDGIVTENEHDITIEMTSGKVTFSREDVLAVDRTKTSKVQMYYARYNKIKDSKDAADFYELATWANENGLARFYKGLLEKTIEINTNHEFARRKLGFELYRGKWHTKEEIMFDKGFVLFDGKWMTESEKELNLIDLKKSVNTAQDKKDKKPDTQPKPENQPKPETQPKEPPPQRHIVELYVLNYLPGYGSLQWGQGNWGYGAPYYGNPYCYNPYGWGAIYWDYPYCMPRAYNLWTNLFDSYYYNYYWLYYNLPNWNLYWGSIQQPRLLFTPYNAGGFLGCK